MSPPRTIPPTTYVYIDGFNLYYGALGDGRDKASRKWLNLDSFVNKLLKPRKFDVVKVKYFTAKILSFDAQKVQRQEFYWRALDTLSKPKFEKIEGIFLKKTVNVQISPGTSLRGKTPTEKGTDVNLAVHLVNDAHLGKFDVAAVVSNDSDLAEAIRIVTQEIGLPVIGFNPGIANFRKMHPSQQLAKFVTGRQRTIKDGWIVNSQFPDTLTDVRGTFRKPKEW